jgi:hypothetical protein
LTVGPKVSHDCTSDLGGKLVVTDVSRNLQFLN